MKKIFSPDIMFGDTLRSCWCYNIEDVDGKIPVNKTLKENGIFVLDIKPKKDDTYWMFSIPINKSWEPYTARCEKISFDLISSDAFDLKFYIYDNQEKAIVTKDIHISDSEEWHNQTIDIGMDFENARLVSFSGPAELLEVLFKDIVLD